VSRIEWFYCVVCRGQREASETRPKMGCCCLFCTVSHHVLSFISSSICFSFRISDYHLELGPGFGSWSRVVRDQVQHSDDLSLATGHISTLLTHDLSHDLSHGASLGIELPNVGISERIQCKRL